MKNDGWFLVCQCRGLSGVEPLSALRQGAQGRVWRVLPEERAQLSAAGSCTVSASVSCWCLPSLASDPSSTGIRSPAAILHSARVDTHSHVVPSSREAATPRPTY